MKIKSIFYIVFIYTIFGLLSLQAQEPSQRKTPKGGLSVMFGLYSGPDRNYNEFSNAMWNLSLRLKQRLLLHQPVIVLGGMGYEGRPDERYEWTELNGQFDFYKFEIHEKYSLTYLLVEFEHFPDLNPFFSYFFGLGGGYYHIVTDRNEYIGDPWDKIGHATEQDKKDVSILFSLGVGLHFLRIINWEGRILLVQNPGAEMKWGPMIYSCLGVDIRF